MKFAFYSDGIDTPRDMQRAVKKAIDNGLVARGCGARADAYRRPKFTAWQDRLGSIEKGKIANLVVTRGEIFDDRTKVEMVFVDGSEAYAGAGNVRWARRRRVTENQRNER